MFRFSVRPNQASQIHWREWGEDAFREARGQDKPIVLFIVAFWCGVCQHMDETALSSDEAIALLNAFFLPVRVEESQRPDVNLRYNQTGGWPTIVFLTPDGDSLVSVNALDSESFVTLLARVIDAHERARAAGPVVEPAEAATPASPVRNRQAPLGPAIIAEIAGMLEGLADPEYGGFGSQDKLLHTEANEFLLHLYETTGERTYLDHVCRTLDTMRQSRTFDATDGGFFRYSSQRDWQQPHPEKLLEDQAALLQNDLHVFVLTDLQAYDDAAGGLIDYLNRTLLDAASGVFFGCQDYVRPHPPAATDGHPYGTSVIDTCIYCDANAHAASALLSAWWILGRADCEARAQTILEWLWRNLLAADGGMCHYWNGEARAPGLLMDTVSMARALLDAHALLGEATYLDRSRQLAEHLLRRFRCPSGGFFDTAEPGPGALQIRMTVLAQNAALAAYFVRLADLSGEPGYRDAARWALQPFPNSHRSYGAFAAGFGHSLSLLLSEPVPVTIAGPPGDARVRSLLRQALTELRPRRPVIRFHVAAESSEARIETGHPI